MSTHTPGPWAVNPFNAQVDSALDGAPVPICQMLWPTTLRTEAETEANAVLIAAAPDLLTACEGAQEWLEGWASAEPYLQQIKDAIVKATGGQHE